MKALQTIPGYPFLNVPDATHDVIEELLSNLWASGGWTVRHEDLLDQWRIARGEVAKDQHWRWWIGEVDGESYSLDFDRREDAVAAGRREFANEGKFWIINARLWADNVKDGDDIQWFAESRGKATVVVADNG